MNGAADRVNVGLENHEVERRLRIFFAVVLGCLIIILGRLWYLQIVAVRYARLADGNRMRQLVLPPSRHYFGPQRDCAGKE